jgi:hypothetical protein
MPGNDLVIVIDQNGIVKAEALDALRNLPDLLGRVGAGITRIRSQRVVGLFSKFISVLRCCGRTLIEAASVDLIQQERSS